MIDSHVHLLPRFVRDIRGAIHRAKEAGLEAVVNSAIELHDYDIALELSSKHPGFIYTTLGIAPSMFEKFDATKALEKIREQEKDIVAVGEVGLDHHWIKEEASRNKQKKVFYQAIELANELKKPLVIHSRKAEEECIKILEKESNVPILLHCFAGSVKLAEDALTNTNWYVSIPTAVVDRKKHRRLAARLPIEKMVVETDTPFLSPLPKRRNEPAFVKYAIREIASLQNVTEQEVDLFTSKNAKFFYRLS